MGAARRGSGNQKKASAAGAVFGLVALVGIVGCDSHSTDTTEAATIAAAVSTPDPQAASPSSLSSSPVAPPPPVPAMTISCPAGGNVASPVFGQQITATAPYTVVIDYGDGDVYTNDDQHLGAIFGHTYPRAGTFTVNALLTDATGQTASATCTYAWAAPVAVVGTATSGGSGSSSGTSSGGSTAGVPSGGPTAICNDGTTSYSEHRQGTCSHHGGVAQWLI